MYIRLKRQSATNLWIICCRRQVGSQQTQVHGHLHEIHTAHTCQIMSCILPNQHDNWRCWNEMLCLKPCNTFYVCLNLQHEINIRESWCLIIWLITLRLSSLEVQTHKENRLQNSEWNMNIINRFGFEQDQSLLSVYGQSIAIIIIEMSDAFSFKSYVYLHKKIQVSNLFHIRP